MELKRIIIGVFVIILSLSACTQRGTEVTNPIDESSVYIDKEDGVQLTLPPGWTYVDYTVEGTPGPEVYTDPLGSAKIVAYFTKDDSNFVALIDTLPAGTSFTDYVNARHADDVVEFFSEEGMEGAGVSQQTPEANGAYPFFYYATDGTQIAILRIEIVATTEAQGQAIMDDFISIVESLLFTDEELAGASNG